MRKIGIKVLSMVLSLSAVINFPFGNGASAQYTDKSRSGMTSFEKVALGLSVGVGAVLICGVVFYALSHDREADGDTGTSVSGGSNGNSHTNPNAGSNGNGHTNSIVNANLTNTLSLCFWHSFVQQMYSLKSFRKFIDEVNLETLTKETRNKVIAFRGFFQKMDSNTSIDKDTCAEFARKLLPAVAIGHQNDINEIFPRFIGDIRNVYDNFCVKNRGCSSNIFGSVVKLERPDLSLQDLLKPQEGYIEEKRDAIIGLLTDEQMKHHICVGYLNEYCGISGPPASPAAKPAPRGEFEFLFEENIEDGLSDDNILHLERLKKFLGEGQLSDDFLNDIANSNFVNECPAVKETIDNVYRDKQIDVPVLDDQFMLFVIRNGVKDKNTFPVLFDNDVVKYKEKDYQLTAVSLHSGETMSFGHYYTYKKEKDGNWYKYDDCASRVEKVKWENVKVDASRKCTMLTFTKMN